MTTLLNNIMILLTVIVSALMIPRLMIDWHRFREGLEDSDGEVIRDLVTSQNAWIVKHAVCAVGALAMVAAVRYLPDLAAYQDLAGSMAIYGMISLGLTVVELLMLHRFENSLMTLRPVRQEAPRYDR